MTTQAAEKQKMVNGVDVDQLFATIEAIKGAPDIAKFQFRISNKWINGGHNNTTITDFYGAGQGHQHEVSFELEADEHQVLLGEDKGPNPVEYLLTGLIGWWLRGRLNAPLLVQNHSFFFGNPAWLRERPVINTLLHQIGSTTTTIRDQNR